MKEKVVVSIVMPTCNSQGYVSAAINSVLHQTHQDLELICVDDCSVDRTADLICQFKERDSRVKLYALNRASGGPATPRNFGLQKVRGQYVAFIDSDDIWHPQKLELQLAAVNKYDLNFVATGFVSFTGTQAPRNYAKQSNRGVSFLNHDKMLRKNRVATSSVLISSKLAGVLRFPEEPEYVAIEDYYAWLYLHQNTKIRSANLHNTLVYYRLREDSISSSKLRMAKKIYFLLVNYKAFGRPLGLRAYFLFISYIFTGSIMTLVRRVVAVLRR